jgi:hypothetical protein
MFEVLLFTVAIGPDRAPFPRRVDLTMKIYLTICSQKKKLRGRSPQENYTDRATAACRRS